MYIFRISERVINERQFTERETSKVKSKLAVQNATLGRLLNGGQAGAAGVGEEGPKVATCVGECVD